MFWGDLEYITFREGQANRLAFWFIKAGEKLKTTEMGEWGEEYNQGMLYSKYTLCCPNCGWPKKYDRVMLVRLYENAIGFRKHFPFVPSSPESIGIVIIGCPECFGKYWFHITEKDMRTCLQYSKNTTG